MPIKSNQSRTHDPFNFVAGDTWQIEDCLKDINGVPLDLTDVAIGWCLDSLDGSQTLISLTLGNGISIDEPESAAVITVTVPATATATLPPGNYTDWLRVKFSDGEVRTFWTGIIRCAAMPNFIDLQTYEFLFDLSDFRNTMTMG